MWVSSEGISPLTKKAPLRILIEGSPSSGKLHAAVVIVKALQRSGRKVTLFPLWKGEWGDVLEISSKVVRSRRALVNTYPRVVVDVRLVRKRVSKNPA